MVRSISVYIDTTIKFYAVRRIIVALFDRGYELIIYCPDSARTTIQDSLGIDADYRNLNEVFRTNGFARKLHRLLMPIAIGRLGTYMSHRYTVKESRLLQLLRLMASALFVFCDKQGLNRRLECITSLFAKNPFPTETVLVVSRAVEKVSFCAKGLKVITLQESWDHAFKQPVGYCSDLVICWNDWSATTWQEFQGDTKIIRGFPEKIDYAISQYNKAPEELKKLSRVLYPLTFCSESSAAMFEEEKVLIRMLAASLSSKGIELYVKPKPNSHLGELDELEQAHSNVVIGKYNQSSQDTYTLTEQYNSTRVDEIRQSEVVVNLGTTFGLDASALGQAVIQLKVNDVVEFRELSKLADYEHLRMVFYKNERLLYEVDSTESIGALVSEIESVRNFKGIEYSEYLNDWLMSGVNREMWLDCCCEEIDSVCSNLSN